MSAHKTWHQNSSSPKYPVNWEWVNQSDLFYKQRLGICYLTVIAILLQNDRSPAGFSLSLAEKPGWCHWLDIVIIIFGQWCHPGSLTRNTQQLAGDLSLQQQSNTMVEWKHHWVTWKDGRMVNHHVWWRSTSLTMITT